MTGGNFHRFSRATVTVPLHSPSGRQMPAVRAVQGDCERVYRLTELTTLPLQCSLYLTGMHLCQWSVLADIDGTAISECYHHVHWNIHVTRAPVNFTFRHPIFKRIESTWMSCVGGQCRGPGGGRNATLKQDPFKRYIDIVCQCFNGYCCLVRLIFGLCLRRMCLCQCRIVLIYHGYACMGNIQ